MAKVDVKEVRSAADAARDMRNWLAVFKTEYSLSSEAYKVLHAKIEEIGKKMNGITCNANGKVESNSVKSVANTIRECKEWIAVFANEHNVKKEAVTVLTKNLEGIAKKLAAIKCV